MLQFFGRFKRSLIGLDCTIFALLLARYRDENAYTVEPLCCATKTLSRTITSHKISSASCVSSCRFHSFQVQARAASLV